jgi:hypothetical protein
MWGKVSVPAFFGPSHNHRANIRLESVSRFIGQRRGRGTFMGNDWLFYIMIGLMPSMVVLAMFLSKDPSDSDETETKNRDR